MSAVALENISKEYGLKKVLDEVSFALDTSDSVGLIGANGSGKTTLLRIIMGEETADSGRISFARGIEVGYLPQDPAFNPEQKVLDAAFSANNEAMKLLHDYELVCAALATGDNKDPQLLAQMEKLSHRIDAAGIWELETNARIVLGKLGISDTNQLMGTLSGGQRKRVALAHALIEQPELLILDEPTNHLDAETITWLEDYISDYTGALLVITHDRYFLDRVTSRIIALDRGNSQVYEGNYSYYVEKKQEEEMREATVAHKQKMLLRQELAWLKRGAKARTTKQKARIDRAVALAAAPREVEKEKLDLGLTTTRLGSKVIELHNISKSYGEKKLIAGFDHIFQPGDRIGIIGPNGTGKTTLLNMLAGKNKPDTGRIEIGQTVVVGYYQQETGPLNEQQRVIEYIREVAEVIKIADGSTVSASQMLERFLFPPAAQYSPIGKLSGGERKRLFLLRMLMTAPNVLILDEPTNDLDIETLMVLEDYLDSFAGVLIVVSHDRFFLDRTVQHIFRLEGEGAIRKYPGNYSAFLEIQAREQATPTAGAISAANVDSSSPETSSVKSETKKLSFKERKELDSLEKSIAAAEVKKGELESRLADGTLDHIGARALAAELEALMAKLEADLERWAMLAENA